MSNLKAILVDDEVNARENLRYLLGDFCKQVTIVGEASNVDDAVVIIEKEAPQLVFLDIEMPQKNGFQLFNEIKEVSFQVIFITAYDNYAIKAFQVAAVDYLLKPVDISLLQKAVEKVELQLEQKKSDDRIKVLQENRKKFKKIAIPYKNDYAILNINDIVCIQADRVYSVISTVDKKQFVASKKLSYYEGLFKEEGFFVRIHRSWVINTNYIEVYSKREKQIQLKTGKLIPVSKGYKQSFETIFIS
ncbi:LytR/AlgR family response regulator transcription factor [Tenacibaculum amylolyticum]|uniref:LytR/AlgR family response regulator transcription factor n=1 Tax=Tenacibaculum amylolyticum TaxID=104269 RepID=UPI0038964613